jgi:hypothetical protein
MWSTYDERYGWTESSTKLPEQYQTTTEKNQFKGNNVEPIKTWTSLDIAKPEWEKQLTNDPVSNIPDVPEPYGENNAPYGKWDTPLVLHSVPFSRASDGKSIRWKLLTSTAKSRGASPTPGSKEAIANPVIPLIVIKPDRTQNIKSTGNKRKHIKLRRRSKQVKNKEKRKRRFGRIKKH